MAKKRVQKYQTKSSVIDILMEDAIKKAGVPSIGVTTQEDFKRIKSQMKGQARADAIYSGIQAMRARKKQNEKPTALDHVQRIFSENLLSKKKGGVIKNKKKK